MSMKVRSHSSALMTGRAAVAVRTGVPVAVRSSLRPVSWPAVERDGHEVARGVPHLELGAVPVLFADRAAAERSAVKQQLDLVGVAVHLDDHRLALWPRP